MTPYALTHTSLYRPDQATRDAYKILSKYSDRFIYLITLQLVAKAMGELYNFRRASN